MWDQSGSDWPQMGYILDFFRLDVFKSGLKKSRKVPEAKLTIFDLFVYVKKEYASLNFFFFFYIQHNLKDTYKKGEKKIRTRYDNLKTKMTFCIVSKVLLYILLKKTCVYITLMCITGTISSSSFPKGTI